MGTFSQHEDPICKQALILEIKGYLVVLLFIFKQRESPIDFKNYNGLILFMRHNLINFIRSFPLVTSFFFPVYISMRSLLRRQGIEIRRINTLIYTPLTKIMAVTYEAALPPFHYKTCNLLNQQHSRLIQCRLTIFFVN